MSSTLAASERGVLLWCRIGHARVLAGGEAFFPREGGAVWIPDGFAATITSAAGTVVVPIVAHDSTRAQAPSVPVAVTVPREWQPVLLHAYALSLGFLIREEGDGDAVLPLLPAQRGGVREPASPYSAQLRAVVDAVRAHPRSSLSMTEHLEGSGLSLRTFERRFVHETGMSFRQWRRRIRVDTGLGALASGSSVSEAAHVAGFSGASAFCRSVREVTGRSPRAAIRRSSETTTESPRPLPPRWAAARSAVRETPFDVVLWAARGSSAVSVGGVRRRLDVGEIAILPAGRPHEVFVDADAVLLPILSRRHGDRRRQQLLVVPSPHRLRAVLLHASVVSYTPLESPGFDRKGLFDSLLAAARAVPLDERRQTSPSLARLTHAARLLREGKKVTHAAAEAGFAHVSTFRRAFVAHYGLLPSLYASDARRTGASTTLSWLGQRRS